MTKRTALAMSGVSAIALFAGSLLAASQAAACTATLASTTTGSTTTTRSVTVNCGPTDDTHFFNTGFDRFIDGTDYEAYDGSGDDTFNMTGGTLTGTTTNPSPEIVTPGTDPNYLYEETNFVSLGAGDDTVNFSGGTLDGSLLLGDGNDTLNMTGGTITGSVFADDAIAGDDTLNIGGTSIIDGTVFAGAGNDTVTISGNARIGLALGEVDSVGLEEGDDTFVMTGGTLTGGVSGGTGNDTLSFSGGTVGDFVAGGDGDDRVFVSGNVVITNLVTMEAGNDELRMSGGTIGTTTTDTAVDLGTGNDTFAMSGGQINGLVLGGTGDDIMTVGGTGIINGELHGNEGADTISIGGNANVQSVYGDDGNDTINIGGAARVGLVSGGIGDDQIAISGGIINGDVTGDGGDDTVTLSAGIINGSINAESVRLLGGTITGDITGLSGNTLQIQAGTNLNLRNGILIQGTNAVGTVTGTDLARSDGNGNFRAQNFSGFTSLALDGSTVGFAGTNQTIADLSLVNGSTLFISGQVSLLSPTGGAGNLTVNNSTVNLINGSTDDRLNVGNLTLNGGTIGIDVNQVTAQADQIITGTFNATGANVVLVNLVGTPQFAAVTIIPIAPIAGEGVPTIGEGSPAFTVAGIPASVASLFTYDVITGPNGGLYLRARAADLVSPISPRIAVDSQPIETVTRSMLGITDDAIMTELGLAVSGNRSAAAPAFGIYASGQLAHVNHDGFDVSGAGISGVGPSFSANDFSVAGSVELDAAKYWGFDQNYGLNIGLFGGYASSDVTLDPTALFADVGNGKNESGMIGGYGLFRQGTSYALIAATGFFGETDLNNAVLNSTGSYGTEGYAVTGSVGHVYALGEKLRFDLRGGLLGAAFQGDPYTDSAGVAFGRSKISFGAVKFEPGFYGDFKLENGMVASPYARMELQQRFGYRNTGDIQGIKIDFNDSDFSAAFSGGLNVKVSEATTLSGELRTKFSSDSSTIAGKLGLKVKF